MPRTLSPLRYPGGKTKMAQFVLNLININDICEPIYVEPFAGGAGIAIDLLLKKQVNKVIINDFDRSIYAIWYSILNYTHDFIELIMNTPINIKEWKKQKEIYTNRHMYDLLEVGFATFFLNRTNNSGIITGGPIGKMDQTGKYKIDCRFNKTDLMKKVSNIAKQKDQIELYNLDAKELINEVLTSLEIKKTFIFFDPPYYRQGKNLYTNFFTHDDHKNLADIITSLEDYHWITTYDYEESISEMYEKNSIKKVYKLQYSARKVRKEKEYLFHNAKTKVRSYGNVLFE
ncbi:DNA adenine methylase [Bacillus halotolerans]|uniref:DNA adenine methylase n=1 Tax=Bacillus halotolerans TaxID=260554 RepID=UPI0024C193BC|nr:DNA adenine methylase [Bacillus halotolerans]WHY24466.1 DNA adenine methylase [Bacillus halotolerans]